MLGDLKQYQKSWIRGDLVAAITVAVILIPQAIAYAQLAGMPAAYGLYASIAPLIVYGLLGTSRQLGIGPVAISSILTFAGVSGIADPFSEEYISLVILLGLLVGVVQWMMGVFRLGFLVNLLSLPVLSGFISAAAVVIIISQLSTVLGIQIDKSSNALLTLVEEIKHVQETKWLPLFIATAGIVFILIMSKVWSSFPAALLVVILASLGVYFLDGESAGLSLVGDINAGLPSLKLPSMSLEEIRQLIPAVLTVALMGCVETLSIAKDLDLKQKQYRVDGDQELKAIGISKIVGSLFQALPSSASFSRSAINLENGAKTGLASILTGLIVLLALIFLTPVFYFIPSAILAAIIIASVIKLVDISYAKRLWGISKKDWLMMLTTFTVTIVGGIESGVIAGLGLSFALVLYESSRPRVFELGRIANTDTFRSIERFPTAEVSEKYQIIRFDERLYFGNADYFMDRVLDFYADRKKKPKYLILDAGHINAIDITGLKALEKLCVQLSGDGSHLLIADAVGVLRDFFAKSGFYKHCQPQYHFLMLADAIDFVEQEDDFSWHSGAVQTNV